MVRFQVLLILIIPVFLVSCATDMSQVKDSDLEWREKNLQIDYQKVYRNINEGFRYCVGSRIVGVPVSNIYNDTKTAHFDIFMPHATWGGIKYQMPSGQLIGMIKLSGNPDGTTTIKAGGYSSYGKKKTHLWLGFAEGINECE